MNRPTKHKNDSEKGGVDENLEHQVFRTLVESGHVFPETEAEVRSAEERTTKHNTPLPAKLRDPHSVLAKIKSKKKEGGEKIVLLPQSQFAEAARELARAARKGADIPLSVEKRMLHNRAKADAEIDQKFKAK
jgi:hypothetical protein